MLTTNVCIHYAPCYHYIQYYYTISLLCLC